MVYKKDKSTQAYYIDDDVDKIFEFQKWINSIEDQEIKYNCDFNKEADPTVIRSRVKELIREWIGNNCKGDLL